MLPTPVSTLIFCLFSAGPICLTAGTKSPTFAQREDLPPSWPCTLLCGSGLGDVLWGPHDTIGTAAGGRVPVGPGGQLGSAHMFPSSGWSANKSRGRTGQRAPACVQPTLGSHCHGPTGVPTPLLLHLPRWTPRASPGINQTAGAALGRPHICRPALPDRGRLLHPASCHDASREPMPRNRQGPAYHFQLYVQEFAGTIHRRLSWNKTRKRGCCERQAQELTARDTELQGGAWTLGRLQSSGLICPMGLRMGVPDTTTEEARPL